MQLDRAIPGVLCGQRDLVSLTLRLRGKRQVLDSRQEFTFDTVVGHRTSEELPALIKYGEGV